MEYEYADIEFAMCAIRVLAIIGVVAVISFFAKSRAMFVAGALGSLLGCVAPHGGIHINGTAEAIYMGHLHFTAAQMLWWGVTGASIACLAVAIYQRFKPRFQFSLRTLLATTSIVAILLGLIQFTRS